MNPALPRGLSAALDALLDGVSRKDIAARAQAISEAYRGGKASSVAVRSAPDALAYAVARLPATYAVAAAVFETVAAALPDFAPCALLDVGAGPGTASWAAREAWPSLKRGSLLDSNPHFRTLARSLAPGADVMAHDLLRDELPRAPLVVASYVLAEIAPAEQHGVVDGLFAASDDVLVLVEPGTPAGFARLSDARAALIALGAHVVGPCTHANACPMAVTDWCHFSQRLPRTRDHLLAKDARVPFEDERYSWLAVSRTRRSETDGHARILAAPDETKAGKTFRLCAADGIEERFVARRDKRAFAAVRRAGWGDVI